jgi:hypothetical protein
VFKRLLVVFAAVALLAPTIVGTATAGSRLGGGVHYLRNLGDLKKDSSVDLSQNSISLMGSYQWAGPLFKVEADVEYIFDYIGSSNGMWEPQAYVLVGGMIYGGAGIGIGYIDGDWQNDPFYALRAGVDLGLAGFDLDIWASYRFQNDDDLKALTGEDLDSLTFAALLRFGI